MGRCRKMLCCAALSCLLTSFASSTHSESYVRVCATTVDAESNETQLAKTSAPGPGKKLVVHLDANTDCVALIVPFAQSANRLANAWRPQVVNLPQWSERTLPAPPRVWHWNQGAESFDLWVFFFGPKAADLEELSKLVAAMQSAGLDQKVLTQQTSKLCEKLSLRMNGKPAVAQEPKAGAELVGGSVRGTEVPWRDYAQKVILNKVLEGELVLRHGR